MVEKQVDKSTKGNKERGPKKPNSRDFAKTGLRETLQYYMPNPGQVFRYFDYYRHYAQKRDRRLIIEIHIKDGVSYEEAKEKIINGIKAAFQPIESSDLKNVKVRKDFKKTLRGLRKMHILTQAEMAERLGVSRYYYSRLESGVHGPEIRVLKKLVREFGLSVEDVYQPALQSDCKKETGARKSIKISGLRKDFNRFLRKVRKMHILTQTEMAERLGFSRDYVSRLERGDRKPGLRFLKRLAEEFELSIEDLHRKVKV